MAARVKVDLNSLGMFRLINSDEVGRDLTRRAELIAAEARASAPVRSGDFKKSIGVISDHTAVTVKLRRRARVVSTDPAALVIEATHGTLARALWAANVAASGAVKL